MSRQPHPHTAADLLLPADASLVEAGYVYIAQPPLYSTKVSTKETVYLKDDAAKDAFMAERPNCTKDFQRLKGLGEMDWDELRDTTMDVASRSLLQVSSTGGDRHEVMSILMGDDVEQRKSFIVTSNQWNLDFGGLNQGDVPPIDTDEPDDITVSRFGRNGVVLPRLRCRSSSVVRSRTC